MECRAAHTWQVEFSVVAPGLLFHHDALNLQSLSLRTSSQDNTLQKRNQAENKAVTFSWRLITLSYFKTLPHLSFLEAQQGTWPLRNHTLLQPVSLVR